MSAPGFSLVEALGPELLERRSDRQEAGVGVPLRGHRRLADEVEELGDALVLVLGAAGGGSAAQKLAPPMIELRGGLIASS
jgi:hypothetical protein